MFEVLRTERKKRKKPIICPWWRKISTIQNDTGCWLVALCGKQLGEKRPPVLKDFYRRRKCPLELTEESAYATPAIVKQRFADPELLIPLSSIIYARVSLHKGAEGIKDLEERWEQELGKIRSIRLPLLD